jgi:hypothetical protein
VAAETIGLFDRDVLLKLVLCDLWGETLSALGVGRPYRLPSCSVAGSASILRRWAPDDAIRAAVLIRLSAVVQAVPQIDDALAQEIKASSGYAVLANTEDIDAGEALLFRMLEMRSPQDLLLTGDKRFVSALRSEFPDRFAVVERRILSFERCLRIICGVHGEAYVMERCRSAIACDGVLRLALGSGRTADAADFLAALVAYDPCRW